MSDSSVAQLPARHALVTSVRRGVQLPEFERDQLADLLHMIGWYVETDDEKRPELAHAHWDEVRRQWLELLGHYELTRLSRPGYSQAH